MGFNATFKESDNLNATFKESQDLHAKFGNVQIIEAGRYPPLAEKPKINHHTLIGDQTGAELDLQDKMLEITEQEIDVIIFG